MSEATPLPHVGLDIRHAVVSNRREGIPHEDSWEVCTPLVVANQELYPCIITDTLPGEIIHKLRSCCEGIVLPAILVGKRADPRPLKPDRFAIYALPENAQAIREIYRNTTGSTL